MNQDRTGYGLIVSVYRDASGGDYTLKGLSSRVTDLTIVGIIDEKIDRNEIMAVPELCRIFAPNDQRPAVVLVKRTIGANVHWHLKPLQEFGPLGRWTMFGGNYAASSDSRLAALTGPYGAYPIHDRIEG